MAASGSTNNFMVNHNTGRVGSETIPYFVPYPDPNNHLISLLNVDDITLIDDQIYYVAFQGPAAHIGHANNINGERTIICRLGEMGWSQSYSGIAASSSSDPLIDDTSNPLNNFLTNRYALFYLKTDTGDLLTAHVYRKNNGFQCYVNKYQINQKPEMRRTLGFDRVKDEPPFYIY